MSVSRVIAAVAAVLIASVGHANAQGPRKLEISFDNGMVTLVAENVTLRDILAEWTRKGGSKIVNGDKLGGSPVYLTEFKNEPESVVLRTLLRDAPGYGMSMRAPAAGASSIATVTILATRTMPVSNAAIAPQVTMQQPNVPQPAPRLISGSPDDEIPPAQPINGNMPPSTPGNSTNNNPNLRTGQDGIVTSTIPGVTIPGPPAGPGRMGGPGTPTGPPTLPPGRGGRGGGGGH
jgi:hypothetical protein